MASRKAKRPPSPGLLDRLVESGSKRIAILGLHPRAGARTVLSSLVSQIQRRNLTLGVTSVPRLGPEAEGIVAEPVTRLGLPAGTVVATAKDVVESSADAVEILERTSWESPRGEVHICRMSRDAALDLYGPEGPEALSAVLRRLEDLSSGPVLVDGGWERRGFASPGVTDGVVIVLSSGWSATPARSAAAAKFHVDSLSVPTCEPLWASGWDEAAGRGVPLLLDESGRVVGMLPPGLEDPMAALRRAEGTVSAILLPHGLNDEFIMPLVRSTFRCTLVVRDATRISLAPIYFQAWLKGEGRIRVVRPLRLIALATNPTNHTGPDADAAEFRQLVASAVPGIPVHDVVLEAEEGRPRPAWKFWV